MQPSAKLARPPGPRPRGAPRSRARRSGSCRSGPGRRGGPVPGGCRARAGRCRRRSATRGRGPRPCRGRSRGTRRPEAARLVRVRRPSARPRASRGARSPRCRRGPRKAELAGRRGRLGAVGLVTSSSSRGRWSGIRESGRMDLGSTPAPLASGDLVLQLRSASASHHRRRVGASPTRWMEQVSARCGTTARTTRCIMVSNPSREANRSLSPAITRASRSAALRSVTSIPTPTHRRLGEPVPGTARPRTSSQRSPPSGRRIRSSDPTSVRSGSSRNSSSCTRARSAGTMKPEKLSHRLPRPPGPTPHIASSPAEKRASSVEPSHTQWPMFPASIESVSIVSRSRSAVVAIRSAVAAARTWVTCRRCSRSSRENPAPARWTDTTSGRLVPGGGSATAMLVR